MRVEPDSNRAWTAIVFVGLRFLVVYTVIMSGLLFSDDVPVGETVLGILVFLVVLTLAVGVPMALWWWLRPGRVSYEVADGELRVLRGAKVVRRHPCADITYLTLHGALNWHALVARNWFTYRIEGWPELLVDRKNWPKPRILIGARSQPAILLWGEERCRQAERDLREAVTLQGAILSTDL